MNIWYNFEGLLFCFRTFGVRLSIDVLDPENQLGSGKIRTGPGANRGLLPKVWMPLKLSKIFIQLNLKNLLGSRYRALDPNLGKNRIRTPASMLYQWLYTPILWIGSFEEAAGRCFLESRRSGSGAANWTAGCNLYQINLKTGRL